MNVTAVMVFQTLPGNKDIIITRNTTKDHLICTPTEESELCVSDKVVLVAYSLVPRPTSQLRMDYITATPTTRVAVM